MNLALSFCIFYIFEFNIYWCSYGPSTVLGVLHGLIHTSLTTNLWDTFQCYYFHFTNTKTEASRGQEAKTSQRLWPWQSDVHAFSHC